MSAYGQTPISEENGTGLGLAYVRAETDVNGVVQTAGRTYWNHATKVYEAGPRVDASHVIPYQRLTTDATDVDNLIQLATLERDALSWPNVVVVIYTLDATGKATGIYRSYPHNVVMALGSVNTTNY